MEACGGAHYWARTMSEARRLNNQLRRRVVVAEAKAVAPDELAKTKKKLLKANAEHKKVAARFNAAASKDRMLQHAAQKIKDAEKDAKMHALAARVVAAEKSAAAAALNEAQATTARVVGDASAPVERWWWQGIF